MKKILSMLLTVVLLLSLSACGKQDNLFADVSLAPWEEAIAEGITPNVGLIVCLGIEKETEGDVGFESTGNLYGGWTKEVLDILGDLKLKKSDFVAPNPPAVGEYYYQVRLNTLPEDAKPAYHFYFYNDFKNMVVYEKHDIYISSWEIENPELIKDLFVKYEMYQKKE